MKETGDVGRQIKVVISLRIRRERFRHEHAGIVDEGVDAAEAIQCSLEHLFRRAGCADVTCTVTISASVDGLIDRDVATTVAPGPIWTPLQVSGSATMEKLEKFGGQTALGPPRQPAELASIYVQLAAADASFATGQVYGSSGGTGQP